MDFAPARLDPSARPACEQLWALWFPFRPGLLGDPGRDHSGCRGMPTVGCGGGSGLRESAFLSGAPPGGWGGSARSLPNFPLWAIWAWLRRTWSAGTFLNGRPGDHLGCTSPLPVARIFPPPLGHGPAGGVFWSGGILSRWSRSPGPPARVDRPTPSVGDGNACGHASFCRGCSRARPDVTLRLLRLSRGLQQSDPHGVEAAGLGFRRPTD